jgi:hypothetical protein
LSIAFADSPIRIKFIAKASNLSRKRQIHSASAHEFLIAHKPFFGNAIEIIIISSIHAMIFLMVFAFPSPINLDPRLLNLAFNARTLYDFRHIEHIRFFVVQRSFVAIFPRKSAYFGTSTASAGDIVAIKLLRLPTAV